MDLLTRIESGRHTQFVITDPARKEALLRRMGERGLLRPVRFMTLADLIERVFLSLKPTARFFAADFLGKRPSVVEPLLAYVPFVEENAYGRERLDQLAALRQHLLQTASAIRPAPEALFAGSEVVFYGLSHDWRVPPLARKLEALGADVECLSASVEGAALERFSYRDTESELEAIARRIRDLHAEGVPFGEIGVANADDPYIPHLARVFRQYGVPFNENRSRPLIAHPPARLLLERLETEETFDAASLQTAWDALREKLDDDADAHRILDRAVAALNPLIMLPDGGDKRLRAARHVLKQERLSPRLYAEAVEIVPLFTAAGRFRYLFLLGAHEGRFPPYAEETDFLDAADKKRLGIPNAQEINAERRDAVDAALHGAASVFVSHAERSDRESFHPSRVLDRHVHPSQSSEETAVDVARQPYSEAAARLLAKHLYDRYVRFKERDRRMGMLPASLAGRFADFDNRFGGLDKGVVQRILPSPLRLSYTSLNRYFQCPFRFLLEDGLKADPPAEGFALDLGQALHKSLERAFSAEGTEAIDETLDSLRDSLTTASEAFYAERAKEALHAAYEQIKTQHERSAYEPKAFERKVTRTLEDGTKLVGIIDKLLADDDGRLLVDYKTRPPSMPTLDVSFALYGVSAQLFFYAWLLEGEEPDARIDGLYEQYLLPKPFKQETNKSLAEQRFQFYALKGYTRAHRTVLERIDSEVDSETFLKGVRFKKDGSPYKDAPLFDDAELEQIIRRLESLTRDAVAAIQAGDFTIRPLRKIQDSAKKKELSCPYCAYQDVCFRKDSDYRDIKPPKDARAAFEAALRKEVT